VVLQTLVFNDKKIYLFLWSVSEQKLDSFTPYMTAIFNKTCPYKITDKKIIKVEHNLIDSSRCLIIIV
jgi:exonuclease V gamma subunit